MAVYLVDAGHTINTGASGYISESIETRRVASKLIEYLRGLGHTVQDVTVDSSSNQVADRIKNIAKWRADYVISIHFNAGKGQGSEILTKGAARTPETERVLSKMNALGFRNRGHKDGTWVGIIKNSPWKIMLVEVCFVDTQSDVNLYNTVTPAGVAKAIAEGVTGQVVGSGNIPTNPTPNNPVVPPTAIPPSATGYEPYYLRVKQFILDRDNIAPERRFYDMMTRAEAFSLLSRMTDKAIPKPPPVIPPPIDPNPNPNKSFRQKIVDEAHKHLGLWYQWGGDAIHGRGYGVDCSHYTWAVLKPFGAMNGYGRARDQYKWCIPVAQPTIGDLAFYRYGSKPHHHVGIYIGNGKVISASGGGSSTNSIAKAKSQNARVKIHAANYRNGTLTFATPKSYKNLI